MNDRTYKIRPLTDWKHSTNGRREEYLCEMSFAEVRIRRNKTAEGDVWRGWYDVLIAIGRLPSISSRGSRKSYVDEVSVYDDLEEAKVVASALWAKALEEILDEQ